MKRSTIYAAAIAVAALSLGACGTSSEQTGRAGVQSGSAEPTDVTDQARGLVGTWEVEARFENPEQPFVTFAADGTWIGTDGCNATGGTYELADDKWTATSGPQTMIACEGAPLPLYVASAVSAKVEAEKLRLTDDAGSTTELRKVSDTARSPLSGFPQGRWGGPGASEPFLAIDNESEVLGFDGCNQLRGTWESGVDGAIVLDVPASTRKMCPDVETWLAGATGARLDTDAMVILGSDGAEIGRLARSGMS